MLLQQCPLPCRSMRSVTLEIDERMVIDVECLDQHACGCGGRVNDRARVRLAKVSMKRLELCRRFTSALLNPDASGSSRVQVI